MKHNMALSLQLTLSLHGDMLLNSDDIAELSEPSRPSKDIEINADQEECTVSEKIELAEHIPDRGNEKNSGEESDEDAYSLMDQRRLKALSESGSSDLTEEDMKELVSVDSEMLGELKNEIRTGFGSTYEKKSKIVAYTAEAVPAGYVKVRVVDFAGDPLKR